MADKKRIQEIIEHVEAELAAEITIHTPGRKDLLKAVLEFERTKLDYDDVVKSGRPISTIVVEINRTRDAMFEKADCLKRWLMEVNMLEGEHLYAERNIHGVRYKPNRHRLPFRTVTF